MINIKDCLEKNISELVIYKRISGWQPFGDPKFQQKHNYISIVYDIHLEMKQSDCDDVLNLLSDDSTYNYDYVLDFQE